MHPSHVDPAVPWKRNSRGHTPARISCGLDAQIRRDLLDPLTVFHITERDGSAEGQVCRVPETRCRLRPQRNTSSLAERSTRHDPPGGDSGVVRIIPRWCSLIATPTCSPHPGQPFPTLSICRPPLVGV